MTPSLDLPDGIVAVVKAACPTCVVVIPALEQIAREGVDSLTVLTQDDPGFPDGLDPVDDRSLERSWVLGVQVTPTLYRIRKGALVDEAPVEGWSRAAWESFTGVTGLAPDLPEHRPGCGAVNVEPEVEARLRRRFTGSPLTGRTIELGDAEDVFEATFARGWTDGLPVVPPTEERVAAMLEGTIREGTEVVAELPPDLVPCTVEKVAVNAVMAGCRPEYLPVVLAAVEAAATPRFNIHGLAATTYFSGPVVIVNGPIAARIGMNSGVNALGQGNRANATIGRALNLTVRNIGGARPGGVDMATLGNPGKYTFCFAEDESGSPWTSLAAERGVENGRSAVTLFAGHGPEPIVDQLSRTPESLARSFALSLRTVAHAKLALAFDAVVVVSPEHARVFAEAGWDKQRLRAELAGLLLLPGEEMARAAGGVAEGLPERLTGGPVPKFRGDGLWFVHAGGPAGLFSGIIGGWVSGESGSQMTTVSIDEREEVAS